LEKGRYNAQRAVNGHSQEFKREELMMLLEGLSFEKMRKSKRFSMGKKK
jgi:hypothetical protein